MAVKSGAEVLSSNCLTLGVCVPMRVYAGGLDLRDVNCLYKETLRLWVGDMP